MLNIDQEKEAVLPEVKPDALYVHLFHIKDMQPSHIQEHHRQI